MGLSEKLIKMHEKLLLINKNKKFEQVVFLAGGAGSGKGFTQDNFMDVSSYKVFDVDAFKNQIIKVAKLKDSKSELANLDLTKPDDVFKLHKYVSTRGLVDKKFSTFLKSVAASDNKKPNIIFDVTLKDIKKFNDYTERLIEIGYKKENMHIVWVLAGYDMALKQNLDPERGRVVPSDILLQTHEGAGETMSEVLKGKLPKNLKGEIYVVLSDKKTTTLYLGKDGLPMTGKSELTGKETLPIKDFLYVKVKDAGKSIMSDSKINDSVYDWVKGRVPASISGFFK